MGRKPGSRNIPKTSVEVPLPEPDFDGTYSAPNIDIGNLPDEQWLAIANDQTPISQPVIQHVGVLEEVSRVQQVVPVTSRQRTGQPVLFLIDGHVQRTSDINGAVTNQRVQQTRLVWATNGDEAVAKFRRHFSALNDRQTTYTVIGAAFTQAIE